MDAEAAARLLSGAALNAALWIAAGASLDAKDHADHALTAKQYVNTTFGTSGDKRIVYNYQYEEDKNEDKRVIYLLRKEYLYEFIDEFEKLVNIG